MKKIISFLVLLIVVLQGYAITAEELYKEFKGKPDAEAFEVGKFGLAFARPFTKGLKLHSLAVLSLDECADEVKAEFFAKVGELDESKYQQVVKEQDEVENTTIYVVVDGDICTDLLVITSGEECVMIHMKGKMTTEELEAFAEEKIKK